MEKKENLRTGKKWKLKMVLLCMICFFLVHGRVYAAEPAVLCARVHDKAVYIYVRGITDLQAAPHVQIGAAAPCDNGQIAAMDFSELDEGLRTLIMIDNSQSIPEKNRQDIQEIIENVVNNAIPGESFRIATFSEEAVYLCDYSRDADSVAEVLSAITYNDQDTYFSDVLYEVIQELTKEDTESGTRILIFSDGADNKYLGIPNDEVRTLVGQNSFAVYTFGVPKKSNTEELENMFSFSRASGASYFLLDGSQGNEEIAEILREDQTGTLIRIMPDDALMDGGEKNISLKLDCEEGAVELTTKVIMPFGEGKNTEQPSEDVNVQPEKKEPEKREGRAKLTPDTNKKEETEENRFPVAAIVLIIILIVLAAITLPVFLVLQKKKKIKPEEQKETKTDPVKSDTDDGETIFISDLDNDPSMGLWHEKEKKTLVLENLDIPGKSYTKKIGENDEIYIRRKRRDISPGPMDIVIEDDSVSAKHCVIKMRGELLYIKDCHSSNGTFYEEIRVYDETPIVSGRQIRAGRYHYRVTLL